MTHSFMPLSRLNAFLRENPNLMITDLTLHPTDCQALHARFGPVLQDGGAPDWLGIRVYAYDYVPRGHIVLVTVEQPDLDAIVAIMRKVLPSTG